MIPEYAAEDWGRTPRRWEGRRNRNPENALTLAEAAVLRRMRHGARNKDVADDLRWTTGTVAHVLYGARKRFGVRTTKELMALPRIIELLDELEEEGKKVSDGQGAGSEAQ